MNKIYAPLILALVLIISSCKSKNTDVETADAGLDTVHNFPVVDFIQNDINDVKKVPYFIYKITTLNKKKDSSNLSIDEFGKYAEYFLTFDINKASIKKTLKESSFNDQTTKSNTLVYTPLTTDNEIRNITVLLDQSTNSLKNIFFQIVKQSKDTTIIEHLQWKAKKSFRITRIKQTKNYDSEESNYISWNDVTN